MAKVTNGSDREVFSGTRGLECNAYVKANKATLGYWLMHKRTAWGWQLVFSALTAGQIFTAEPRPPIPGKPPGMRAQRACFSLV